MLKLNEFYCIDCLEGCKQLDDKSIDLIITSPPYSNIKSYADGYKGIKQEDYCDWFIPRIQEFERVLRDKGSFILNINDKVSDGFRDTFVFELIYRISKETGFKLFERLFWNKMKCLPHPKRFGDRVEYIFWFAKEKGFTFNMDPMRVDYDPVSIKRMNNKLQKRFARTENDAKVYKDWSPNPLGALPSTLVSISSESTKKSENHVAVYPEKLVEYFLLGSTNEGDVVLDPFNGVGTTAVVAKRNKRNFIGFDIIQDYIDQSLDRISR